MIRLTALATLAPAAALAPVAALAHAGPEGHLHPHGLEVAALGLLAVAALWAVHRARR